MKEIPLQFGKAGRLFGVLTLASDVPNKPSSSRTFVFLNAGLLHRVGPYRLHVTLARELAELGFNSFRVDLAGIGDSFQRTGLEYTQSVAIDYSEITKLLETELGPTSIVLAGLCSGADNAIRLAIDNSQVAGLILLDPVCEKDNEFEKRARRFRVQRFLRKCLDFGKYWPWLKRKIEALSNRDQVAEESVSYLALRELPSADQTAQAIKLVGKRGGRVFSAFTQYALEYYNQSGQFGDVLDIDDYQQFCTEAFWPQAEHTYPLEAHRRQLIEDIKLWASWES